MIEVEQIETIESAEKHRQRLEAWVNEGWDITSTHVTYDGLLQKRVYTTFLTRDSDSDGLLDDVVMPNWWVQEQLEWTGVQHDS